MRLVSSLVLPIRKAKVGTEFIMGLNENIFWKQNSDTDLDLVELGVGRDQQLLSGSVRVRQMDK